MFFSGQTKGRRKEGSAIKVESVEVKYQVTTKVKSLRKSSSSIVFDFSCVIFLIVRFIIHY